MRKSFFKKILFAFVLASGLLFSQIVLADWSQLDGNLPSSNDISIYVFQNNIYVVTAGQASNTIEIHKWQDGAWNNVGVIFNVNPWGIRLTSFQGKLHVAMADSSNGTEVYEWNGVSSWSQVGSTFNTGDGPRGVGGFVEWDNKLWVSTVNDVTQNVIFVYDTASGTWNPMGHMGTGSGDMGLLGMGDLIVSNNNELHYSGQGFSYYNIAVYKYLGLYGGEPVWTKITDCSFLEPGVFAASMTIHNNQLHYVVCETSGYNVYKYNSEKVCNSERVGNSGFSNGRIVDIASSNNHLFALADNWAVDDMEVWILCPDNNWYQVGSGFGDRNTSASGYQSLTDYDNVLTASGYEETGWEQAVYSFVGNPVDACLPPQVCGECIPDECGFLAFAPESEKEFVAAEIPKAPERQEIFAFWSTAQLFLASIFEPLKQFFQTIFRFIPKF